MEPDQELVDAIYREKVLRARATPPATKALEGPRLFDWACRVTMAGIRHQHPHADERQVQALLRERVAMREQMEQRR